MHDRREFIYSVVSAALAAAVPLKVSALGRLALPRRAIPGSDETLAIVGLGNARVFYESDMEMSRELIRIFLEHGGSYVDTGWDARETVGKIVRENDAHEQLFLGTYIEGEDLPSMRAEIRRLLDIQGGESLDLVQVMAVDDFSRRRDQFAALKDEGLTRYLGVARYAERFYPPMMKLMEDDAVDFIQVNYSLMEPEAANEILPLAQETGTAVITNRPFINGDYFGLVRGQELPEWAADFDCHSWAQFSLKYILAHPAVNCVLTETSNPEHAIDNLSAGFGRLPDIDQRQRMEAVIRALM
ncbi:MAG: aldo/keto reductase [Proteobacteria bacterium]|nr:aldo/keto reductase [Pseudomonadota bacterium]